MMYGAFHPKSGIDSLYLKRKYGIRGLISIEVCVRSKENDLGLYVRDSNEMVLKNVKKVGMVSTENLSVRKDFKKIVKTNLEIYGKERKCMESLLVRCLKRFIKIVLGSGWCKRKQQFAPHKIKH